MKKIIVILMAIAMIASTLALSACGNSNTTTTEPGATTAPTTTTGTTPNTTVPETTTTTPTTTEPPEPVATPVLRDPAKVYHVETKSYKTSSKNEDADFILDNSAGVNDNERFADGAGQIIYMIDLSGMIEPTVTLHIRQQYYVAVLPTLDVLEDEYIEIANFNNIKDQFPSDAFNEAGAYTAGTNDIEVTINPYQYEIYDMLYILIANSNPSTGWGGTIMRLDINQYVEGEGPVITTIDNSPGTVNNKEPGMVQVDEVILTTAADEDEKYIFKNTSQATGTRRYCDGNKYIVYRFDIRELYEPTFDLYVAQNYKIEISHDGESWVEFVDFSKTQEYTDMYNDYLEKGADSEYNFVASGDLESGNNFTHIIIDPYNPGLDNIDAITGNLYIRISDCFPAAGWGGAVENITIRHWVNP